MKARKCVNRIAVEGGPGKGVVADSVLKAWLPISLHLSGQPYDLGGAKGADSDHQCDADANVDCLAVSVSSVIGWLKAVRQGDLKRDGL